jgi:hypothetical protein
MTFSHAGSPARSQDSPRLLGVERIASSDCPPCVERPNDGLTDVDAPALAGSKRTGRVGGRKQDARNVRERLASWLDNGSVEDLASLATPVRHSKGCQLTDTGRRRPGRDARRCAPLPADRELGRPRAATPGVGRMAASRSRSLRRTSSGRRNDQSGNRAVLARAASAARPPTAGRVSTGPNKTTRR